MQVDAGMQQHSADDAHHRITEVETKLFEAQAAHAAAADQRINAIEGQVQQIGQAVHRAEAKADATQNELGGLFAEDQGAVAETIIRNTLPLPGRRLGAVRLLVLIRCISAKARPALWCSRIWWALVGTMLLVVRVEDARLGKEASKPTPENVPTCWECGRLGNGAPGTKLENGNLTQRSPLRKR